MIMIEDKYSDNEQVLLAPPTHLLDCKNCNDEYGYPHQLMHHENGRNDNGKCMIGELWGIPCQCPGFEEVE